MISRAQEETNLKAFEEGRAAHASESSNPYPASSPYHSFWEKGREYATMSDQKDIPAREDRLRELAERLMFKVTKSGELFTLVRTADVSEPVIESDLTLHESEELLETWKLRGPHGG